MSRRIYYLLGAALLAAFAAFAVASFRDALTPYVSFAQARASGSSVQVAGALVEGTTAYQPASESLQFLLHESESGETLPVRYRGVRPANFEDAISIVAIGRWNAEAEELEASKLLVKCPSKYQGTEVQVYEATPTSSS